MVALGFSSGLPFYLIFDTLSAWLRQVGLSLEVIGLFSLATLVFSLKFLCHILKQRRDVQMLRVFFNTLPTLHALGGISCNITSYNSAWFCRIHQFCFFFIV